MTAEATGPVPAAISVSHPDADRVMAEWQQQEAAEALHAMHGNADPHCGKCRAGRERRHRNDQNAAVLIAAIRDAGDAVSTAQGAHAALIADEDPALFRTADGADLARVLDEIGPMLRNCARIAERRQQAAGTED